MTIQGKILVPRVADPPNEETRLRRHTELVAAIINSMILRGDIILTAPDVWRINANTLATQYSPDNPPPSPAATNDEFGTGGLSAPWTAVGPPSTLDLSTYLGWAFIADASGSTVGIREDYTPGANAFTVAIKVEYEVGSAFSFVGLQLTDSSNNPLATASIQNDSGTGVRARTGFDGTTAVTLVGFETAGMVYILIQRDATTNYTIYYSVNGITYLNVATFSKAGTVGRVHLQVNGQGGSLAGGAFDFVRMFTTQTGSIGGIGASGTPGPAGGTVTSVSGSGGTTGLTLTGGPITTIGALTLGGDLVIANGGTGATTAAGARANLGVSTISGTGTLNTIPKVTNATGPVYGDSGLTDDGTSITTGEYVVINAPASGRGLSIVGNGVVSGFGNNKLFRADGAVFYVEINNNGAINTNGSYTVGSGSIAFGSSGLILDDQPISVRSAAFGTIKTRMAYGSDGFWNISDASQGVDIGFTFTRQTSTSARIAADVTITWATSTDATRKGRFTLSVWDTVAREAIILETDGARGTSKVPAGGSTAYARLGGTIFDHFADAGNGTTVETDLYSDTIAAATLSVNADKLNAEYGGVFVSSATATRQLKIYFAGTAIFDSGALTLSLSSAWVIYLTVIRVSSSVVRYSVTMTTEGAALAAYTAVGELTGLTLTNTAILKITGTAAGVGAATNDIVAKLGTVDFKPAA